jgi:hypothetical protein
LTRSIEVRNPYFGIGAATSDFDKVVIKAKHGGHCSRTCHSGFVHRICSFGNKSNAIFKGQSASSGESGVLAKTVSSRRSWFYAQTFNGIENDQACEERRQLCIVGSCEFFGFSV